MNEINWRDANAMQNAIIESENGGHKMKNSGLMDLVMMAGLFAVLACGALAFGGLRSLGVKLMPAEQASWENLQPIQPKGNDGYEDKAWMEGDRALAEGNYFNAQATAIIEQAYAEACATRNNCYAPNGTIAMKPGTAAGGGVVLLIGGGCLALILLFKWVGK